MSFADYASGIRFPDCSKLVINWTNDNDLTIFQNDVIVKCFWRFSVSLMKFSYWSKFHVSIITGSGKGLTRNLEIWNSFAFWKSEIVWVLPNIWRLGQVGDTKFSTNVSNIILLNAAKFQGCNFYRFRVIKGKPTREMRGGRVTPLPFNPG